VQRTSCFHAVYDVCSKPCIQDHLLPYMIDPRHAPDTLFFVCEEDFRLYPSDEMVHAESVASSIYHSTEWPEPEGLVETVNAPPSVPKLRLSRAFHPESGEPFAPEEGSGPPATEADAGVPPTEPGWEEVCGAFYRRPAKPSEKQQPAPPPSREIEDLVKICTLASRQDCGNLVWLSYNAKAAKGGRCKPSYGSHMVALSLKGARKLVLAGRDGFLNKGHWDIVLRDYLNSPDKAQELGASYVYPAIGNYKEHRSFNQKGEVRTGRWGEKWCQPGTRAEDGEDFRTRWLCKWLPAGHGLNWTCKIQLPEHVEGLLSWKTLRADEDVWARWERNNLEWWHGARPLLTETISPAATAWTLEETRRHGGAMSKRAKRARRAKQVGYAHRIFVDDPIEVQINTSLCVIISGEPFRPAA